MTAATPDVDVVIATHDRPVWVREAIDAVLAQEYSGRIRCIVVFDGTEPDAALERRTAERAERSACVATSGPPDLPARATRASWPATPSSWPSATTTTCGCPGS